MIWYESLTFTMFPFGDVSPSEKILRPLPCSDADQVRVGKLRPTCYQDKLSVLRKPEREEDEFEEQFKI